ncbi:RAD55 family ATPase [Pseudoduganella sp. UC29_106]|uniref:RAD55 family ATPase n=1 Tax=Pseudoduganella sp. UC29_106 TaxID=3374553 RepID=UPI0037570F48
MKKVEIELLATGVPGLDTLLGGGVPEFSFNLLAGTPGSGKTTLAHQIMFSLANPNRRALFFTVLGEPPLKMLRYQQQFSSSISTRSTIQLSLSIWRPICCRETLNGYLRALTRK